MAEPDSGIAQEPRERFAADCIHSGHEAAITWLDPHAERLYWLVALLVLGGGGVVLAVNWEGFIGGYVSMRWIVGYAVVFGGAAVLIPLLCILPMRRDAIERRAICRRAMNQPDPRRWLSGDAEIVLATALSDAGLTATRAAQSRNALGAIRRQLDAYGIRPPGLIVDRRLARAVLSVETTEEFIEPEPIESQMQRSAWIMSIVLLLVLVAVIRLTGMAPLFYLLLIPAVVGELLRHVWRTGRSAVGLAGINYFAGVGFVESPSGERIGSWQALTLISSDSGGSLLVRIVHEHGIASFRFSSPADPGFIAFWQRWNHPHPRPELLGGQTRL
ncbi:MAG: hypothetical protein IT430_00520 [Phycisphaerales bacterium]|nr:hypothetical protein [Phycisphaerales bacterium]